MAQANEATDLDGGSELDARARPEAATRHVFVSYARSTEPSAKLVIEALQALGHDVWWDGRLPAHGLYADVLDERVQAAGAVVVVWSADALKSHWVRGEADRARKAGTLVQLSIDGAA